MKHLPYDHTHCTTYFSSRVSDMFLQINRNQYDAKSMTKKPWYKLFNKWVQGYAFLSCSSIFLTLPFKTNYGVCNNFWLGVIGISPNASVNTFEIQRSALVIFGLARFQQPSFKTPRSSVYVYYVRLAKRINDSLDCQHRSEVFTEIDVGFVWLEISPSLLILLGRNVT